MKLGDHPNNTVLARSTRSRPEGVGEAPSGLGPGESCRYQGKTVTVDRLEPDGGIRIKFPNGRTKRVQPSELTEERRHSPPVRAVEDGAGSFVAEHIAKSIPPERPMDWERLKRESREARAALIEQPKPKTPRSRGHLAFVRSLPCAWCGVKGRTQASHHGVHGTSTKASDIRAIPLCVECHTGHHGSEGLPKSSMDREQTRTWFLDRALDVCEKRLAAMAEER